MALSRNKVFLISIVGVIILLSISLFAWFRLAKTSNLSTVEIIEPSSLKTIAIYDVEIADERAEQAQGLMYRKKLGEGKGMLFIFPETGPKTFWMKNTLIPLDIIFIREDQTIYSIKEKAFPCRESPCPKYSAEAPIKYVLEINAGETKNKGIRKGNLIRINRQKNLK